MNPNDKKHLDVLIKVLNDLQDELLSKIDKTLENALKDKKSNELQQTIDALKIKVEKDVEKGIEELKKSKRFNRIANLLK